MVCVISEKEEGEEEEEKEVEKKTEGKGEEEKTTGEVDNMTFGEDVRHEELIWKSHGKEKESIGPKHIAGMKFSIRQ